MQITPKLNECFQNHTAWSEARRSGIYSVGKNSTYSLGASVVYRRRSDGRTYTHKLFRFQEFSKRVFSLNSLNQFSATLHNYIFSTYSITPYIRTYTRE